MQRLHVNPEIRPRHRVNDADYRHRRQPNQNVAAINSKESA